MQLRDLVPIVDPWPTVPTHLPQPWLPVSTFQTLAALPDQDSFYDVTDALEQQGMEALVQRLLGTAGTDVDLRTQLTLYEVCQGEGCSSQVPIPFTGPQLLAHIPTTSIRAPFG